MTNDEKLKQVKRKKLERNLVMILSSLTIILEVLALFNHLHFLWGVIPFALCYLIKGMGSRDTTKKVKKEDKTKDKKEDKKETTNKKSKEK